MTDLFQPRLPPKRLHKHFNLIRTDPACANVMPVIQSWAAGLLDRKGETNKFVNEFQTTFNSALWELYLNKMLIELGFSVDYTKVSPDFVVTTPSGFQFCIEAVISDQPSTVGPQHLPTRQDFKTSAALKLVGKITDKRNIFRGVGGKKFPYSSLDHVRNKPFVVAIAPFDSDISLTQNNEIINLVLFGIGPPLLAGPNAGTQNKVKSIIKASGASVDMGIFTNDSFAEISAVIFSTTGTFGKALIESKADKLIRATHYREINKTAIGGSTSLWRLGTKKRQIDNLNFLLSQRMDFGDKIAGPDVSIYHSSVHKETHFDGLHVYYNPYADIPLDQGVMWPAEITHNFYDTKKEISIHAHPDGALVSRQLFEPNALFLHHLLKHYGFIG